MILISDKDEEMRQILQSQLQGMGLPISHAETGKAVLRQVDEQGVKVWITDAVVQDSRLGAVVQEIRKISPTTQILVLLNSVDNEQMEAELTSLIEAGVSDFLVRPFERSALVQKVSSLLRLSGAATPQMNQVLEIGSIVLNPGSFDVHCGSQRCDLTPSEFKLLHALMLKRDAVLSRDQLIQMVQGAGIVVIERAVDTHIASLRKKLGPCAGLIQTVRGVGYRLSLSP